MFRAAISSPVVRNALVGPRCFPIASEPFFRGSKRRRLLSSTAPGSMAESPKQHVAATPDANSSSAITASLSRLRLLAPATSSASESEGGRWTVTAAGDGIERSFKFKTFAKTWDFMTAVSLQCKLKNHHPEWSNVYNTTFIRWTTHSPSRSLTLKDTDMAAICDSLARDFGEIWDPASSSSQASATAAAASSGPTAAACSLQGLANQAVGVAGGDCCAPRKTTKT